MSCAAYAGRCQVEQRFIDWLVSEVGVDPRNDVGIGDDAAVMRPPAGRRTVLCTDMLCEGVHFPASPGYDPRAVGRKAIAVNLSDVAAMAGRPESAVVSVALPRRGGQHVGEHLLAGMLEEARRFGVALVGGDTTSWDGPLVVNVAMLGSVVPGRVWRRDGAREGDVLLVTGACGGSLLGRHLAVQPRVTEARLIAEMVTVHAAIDISDGLALDLSRMLEASGCAAEVDLALIPIHPDAVAAAEAEPTKGTACDRALGDGEDFELLLSLAPAEAEKLLAAHEHGTLAGWPGTSLTEIGRVVAGRGMVGIAEDGSRSVLPPRGYLHAFN